MAKIRAPLHRAAGVLLHRVAEDAAFLARYAMSGVRSTVSWRGIRVAEARDVPGTLAEVWEELLKKNAPQNACSFNHLLHIVL